MSGRGRRAWVSKPEVSDLAVRAATGTGFDEWVGRIEASGVDLDSHSEVAQWLRAEFDLSSWWVQTITVAFERITGRRLPHQRADGTFSVTATRTFDGDADSIRTGLLEQRSRELLFGGVHTELRSAPRSRVIRMEVGPGLALITVESLDADRVRVSIQHDRLPHESEVEVWTQYWSSWLDVLAARTPHP